MEVGSLNDQQSGNPIIPISTRPCCLRPDFKFLISNVNFIGKKKTL